MNRLVLVSFCCLYGSVLAQTQVGIKGGLNIADIVMTNYINPDAEADLQLKAGLHAGFFVSGMVNEKVGMAAELLYSNKGVKADVRANLHYITLPLMIRYALTEKMFAEIGPEPGYLAAAQSPHGNLSNTYNNKFDLGLNAGFHFEMAKFNFGLRYCAGLFSVRNVESFNVPANERLKYQNRVLQISLGYQLREIE